MRYRSSIAAIVIALITITFSVSGCLDTQRKLALTYDAAKDEFQVLRLYYHISAENDADMKHLVALYNNRDHLLLYDPVAFLTESAAVYLGDGKVRILSLGQPVTSPVAIQLLDGVNLDAIKIKPGKFFLSSDNTACYYQQMTVPGLVIDQLLKKCNTAVQSAFAEELELELKRRAGGGVVSSIDELQSRIDSQLEKQITAAATSQPADAAQNDSPVSPALQDTPPLAYLGTDSIDLLLQACQNGTFAATRNGEVLNLPVHLSPVDAKKLKTSWDALKSHAKQILAKIPDNPKKQEAAAMLHLLDQLVLSDSKDGQFTITLDVVKFVQEATAAMAIEHAWEPVQQDKQPQYGTVVEGLKDVDIPIDPNIKLDQIMPDFFKGTLPVNLPDKSVAPGIGIFPEGSEAPATQPAESPPK